MELGQAGQWLGGRVSWLERLEKMKGLFVPLLHSIEANTASWVGPAMALCLLHSQPTPSLSPGLVPAPCPHSAFCRPEFLTLCPGLQLWEHLQLGQ